ncbi:uncharacterized protein LOC110630850 isoform X1 [Manihot esculenta]|uniref:Uncharacterized protein n=1 Tax=Manihot esculenta TaxID=3983 RepID=A0ACB7GEK6_MANES|nr:uncharacterized protein LOC110630850 isoform X1 [Manihot esculenta]KAG8638431.1 hypothetical protein MANES_14G029701v8 [Manihot esculenta]
MLIRFTSMEQCYKTGCVGQKSFQHCQFLSNAKPIDGPWYLQEPLYLQWKQWDCHSGCPYNCLVAGRRQELGDKPIMYRGNGHLNVFMEFSILFGDHKEARNFFVHGQVEVSAKWGNTIKHAPKYESMWGYGFNSAAYLGKCYSSCIPVQVVDGGCGWRSRYALGYHTTSHHITDLLMLTVFGCGALSGMMRSLVLQVS